MGTSRTFKNSYGVYPNVAARRLREHSARRRKRQTDLAGCDSDPVRRPVPRTRRATTSAKELDTRAMRRAERTTRVREPRRSHAPRGKEWRVGTIARRGERSGRTKPRETARTYSRRPDSVSRIRRLREYPIASDRPPPSSAKEDVLLGGGGAPVRGHPLAPDRTRPCAPPTCRSDPGRAASRPAASPPAALFDAAPRPWSLES